MKALRMVGGVLLSSLLTGCVHYMPAAVSNSSIGPKEHPVAVVSGEASEYYIFGLGPTGNASLQAAVEDAKSLKKSDTMVNVFVDRQVSCFPICGFSIFRRVTTMVYGTLIEYDDPWTKTNVLPEIQEKNPELPEKIDIFSRFTKGDLIRVKFKMNTKMTVEGTFMGYDTNPVFFWMRRSYNLLSNKYLVEHVESVEPGTKK